MEKLCKNCKNFRQHYVRHGKGFRAITYGHCVYPRLKKRFADQEACEKFIAQKNI